MEEFDPKEEKISESLMIFYGEQTMKEVSKTT